ncbi:MAG: hypothetical protein WCP85_26210 [Mariniphaga sp.]
MLYIILVISYLAGCSAWVFRSTEKQSNEIDPSRSTSDYLLYENQLANNFHCFQNNDVDNSQTSIATETGISPPFLPYSEAVYVPVILAGESPFHGYVDFARPPPVFIF